MGNTLISAPSPPAIVLRLSATGLLTDEVRRHLAGAMAALGARSKLEAVVLALRLGLLDPPAV